MKQREKISVLFHCFLFILLALSCGKEKEVKPIRYIGSYNRDFNDLNEKHLSSATKLGISPLLKPEDIEKEKKKLKQVFSNGTYEVEELKHSLPYLIPEAFDLLNKVGKNFQDSLKSLDAPRYKLIVTSLTRTKDNIKNLRKKNGNSSENSAHLYATTFDISWVRFIKDDKRKTELNQDQLKMVLASVLRDLKKENACYIKHEKKQGCFHITTR